MRKHKPEPVALEQLAKEIVVVSAARQMEEDYTTYAAYVNLGRALPSVLDGLKPVQRRVLYAMHELDLAHDAKFKKCARIDGDVTGKFSPHGSAYGVLVNMANDWANRYAFVDGQGNFGTTEDGAAAARYTEARLNKFSEFVLTSQLDSNWIDFKPNYDASTTEPVVLPARLPTLLLRDTSGIGVATACRHVSYLLSEVAELSKAALKSELKPDDGLRYISAPDFAMGGDLLHDDAVGSVIKSGFGTLRLYAKFKIEDNLLVCYELPQDVSGETVLTQTFDLIKSEHISRKMLADARNETDRSGTRIVWELSNSIDIPALQKLLYDKTDCRTTVSVNAVSVDPDGKSYSLKGVAEVANAWSKFRKSYESKRLAYELNTLNNRRLILEGLLIALDNIVAIAEALIAGVSIDTLNLGLNSKQIDAVESMPLRTLKAKSRAKLTAEIAQVDKDTAWRNKVLSSDSNFVKHLCRDVDAMASEFSDEKRTGKLDVDALASVAAKAAELAAKAAAEKHNGYLIDCAQDGRPNQYWLRAGSRSKKFKYVDCGPTTDVGIAAVLSDGGLYFVPVSALQPNAEVSIVVAVQNYTGAKLAKDTTCCWSRIIDRNSKTDLRNVLVLAGPSANGKKTVAKKLDLSAVNSITGKRGHKHIWTQVCSALVAELPYKSKTVSITTETGCVKYKLQDLDNLASLGKALATSVT